MIFTTKNKEFAIFGQTLSDVRKKLIDFNDIWMQGGRFDSGKSQLIPEKNLVKELSLDEAEQQLKSLNQFVVSGNMTYEQYFSTIGKGNSVLRTYVTTTDQQSQSIQGLIKASQDARAAQLAHNEAIKAQTFSAKAGKIALQALATAGNMIAFAVITKGIELIASSVNNWIHRVEIANEAMVEAVGEYESAKSSLESVNSELEEQNKKLDELKSKDKLTYSEKGQLEELQKITKELLLQQDIEEKKADKASRDAAEKAIDAFETQYGDYDISKESVDNRLRNVETNLMFPYPDDANDIAGNIAAYIRSKELYEEAQANFEQALNNQDETKWYASEVQSNAKSMNDYRDSLNLSIGDLQEKRLALEDEYNKALAKRQDGMEPLTSSEQEVINTYESIYNTIKMIYEYTNKSDWNRMEITGILNTDGIEKSKAELIDMAKQGILTPEAILGYPNLSEAIFQSDILFDKEQLPTETFCEYIYSLADDIADSSEAVFSSSEKLSSSTDSFDKFQSSVKSAAAAYTTLSTGNYSSSELLDSIQAISQAASDMGQSFDWESIATSDNPLQAIQDAIESVSQSYADSVLSGAGIDVDSKFGQLLANIVQESYASESALSGLRTQIDSLQNAYSDLTSIVDSYNETGYINFDQLETLLSMEPQYLACLMDENGQLLLNQESMLSLANQRLNAAETQAVQQAISELGLLTFQAETNAVKENASAFSNAVNDLAIYNGALAETIGESSIAASTIRDLNAAISGAKSDGADDTQVDTILNNLDTKLQFIKNSRANLNNNLGNIMGGSGSGSGSGPSSARSEFSETIDFFKERVEILDDALSHLDTTMDNVSGSFGKNNLVDAQLGINEEKFAGYTDALAMYTRKADEAFAKLPADIASRVKDGAVTLTDFVGDGNRDVVDAIKDYQSWADEISACKEQLAKLEKEIRQLELEKFNNIMADFNHQFDLRSDSKDLLSKQIDLLKEAGQLIGESFYTAQIQQSRKQLQLLETEKAQLAAQMASAIQSGRIRKGTDEWLEMVNALSDVDGSILDCKKSIESFDNSLLELHTEAFDRIQQQFSGLDAEISNLAGLFAEFEISDEKGIWSKEGLAQLGLLAQQYELSQYQIRQYKDEIDALNRQYLSGRYSAAEYADRLSDLSAAQWDAVKASESAKDAILDLNETRLENQIGGIQKEIDAYKELTDAQIQALHASKDLHDYENSIAEKTKSVTDLQRQIAAMQNDSSAATVAKRKQLEDQLAQARKDLDETQYQHAMEVREDALNSQYEDYEKTRNEEIEALRASLDDREAMLAQSFEAVKTNAASIGQEITWTAARHGISVSGSLISSWQAGQQAIASYGETLSQGASAFIGNLLRMENETWNLQAQADAAADSLAWMFSAKADALVNELAASYYCEENLQIMTLALQESLVGTLERKYNASDLLTNLNSITTAANAAADAVNKIGTGDKTPENNKKTSGGGGPDKPSFARLSAYAGGTRSTRGGLIITDEKGYEAKFPRLSSGRYTLANEGTQIFTRQQTDNLYRMSKLNPTQWSPANVMEDLWKNTGIQKSAVNRTLNHYVPVQIGNLVNVEGSVSSSDIRQMESIADRAVNKLVNRLHDGITYGR